MEMNTDYIPQTDTRQEYEKRCCDCAHIGLWAGVAYACGYPFKSKFMKSLVIDMTLYPTSRFVGLDDYCGNFKWGKGR